MWGREAVIALLQDGVSGVPSDSSHKERNLRENGTLRLDVMQSNPLIKPS